VVKAFELDKIYNLGSNTHHMLKTREGFSHIFSILWHKSLKKITKKRIYKTMVLSVVTYGVEVWHASRKNRNRLLATKMDYIKRSCRRIRLDRIWNEMIKRSDGDGKGQYR
jgi:hypothetical protein